jgi:plasmid stability protein
MPSKPRRHVFFGRLAMARVIVNLTDQELEALRKMAAREVRPMREQARFLIIRALDSEQVISNATKSAQRSTTVDSAVNDVAAK